MLQLGQLLNTSHLFFGVFGPHLTLLALTGIVSKEHPHPPVSLLHCLALCCTLFWLSIEGLEGNFSASDSLHGRVGGHYQVLRLPEEREKQKG